MFWLVESNFYKEANFEKLIDALERQGINYAIVKRYGDAFTPEINITDDNVFVCGTTGMGRVAKSRGWVPGYFDDNLDYRIIMAKYGQNCLNHKGYITTLAEVTEPPFSGARFFTRPTSDKKSYSGTVFDWENFYSWRRSILDNENTQSSRSTLKPNDAIVIAPLTTIYAEYRFFVVDGEIVTGSLYKRGSQVNYQNIDNSFVDSELLKFAKEMIDTKHPNSKGWVPNRAFALDIADTPDGYKVIEINAINSSGFYACDMSKFVNAISNMQF